MRSAVVGVLLLAALGCSTPGSADDRELTLGQAGRWKVVRSLGSGPYDPGIEPTPGLKDCGQCNGWGGFSPHADPREDREDTILVKCTKCRGSGLVLSSAGDPGLTLREASHRKSMRDEIRARERPYDPWIAPHVPVRERPRDCRKCDGFGGATPPGDPREAGPDTVLILCAICKGTGLMPPWTRFDP